MWWEEAALASGSSLVLFVVFSTQAAMRLGRFERFPVILWRPFAPGVELGPVRRWIAIVGASTFAAVGQSLVLAVVAYRGDELGLAARLMVGGELVAAFVWVLLLGKWVRASSKA